MPVLKSVTLHGSVIAQTLLQIHHPAQIVAGLLDLSRQELLLLACDSCGCHVLIAFINSQTVSDKSKANFVVKMKVCLYTSFVSANSHLLASNSA